MRTVLHILFLTGLSLIIPRDVWAQPVNDNLADAVVITEVPYQAIHSNEEATVETDEIRASCGGGNNSVWFQFTPSESQTYVATFGGAFERKVISVWEGTAHPLSEIGCDANNLRSKAWFEGEAGATYWIRVTGENDSNQGQFAMRIAASPVGDDLNQALLIQSLPFEQTISNLDATLETDETPPSCGGGNNSIWWRFTPSESQTYVASVNNFGKKAISLWEGAAHPLSELKCDLRNPKDKIWWEGEAGTTYWIRVSGDDDLDEDELTLRVDTAPTGDDLTEAPVIQALPYEQTLSDVNATLEVNETLPSCGGGDNSMWWQFSPTESNTYVASITGTNTKALSVWEGTAHPLSELGCDLGTYIDKIRWEGEAGTTYWIRATGDDDRDENEFTLRVAEKPAGDDLEEALIVGAIPFEQTIPHLDATLEPNEVAASCGDANNSVWWQFTPTVSQTYVASVQELGAKAISLWEGIAHPLSELECDFDTSKDKIWWEGEAGTTYLIRVTGARNNDQREFTLQITAAPLGDDLAEAPTITDLPYMSNIFECWRYT